MTAKKIYMEMQPGDVLRTYTDITDLERNNNFKPKTSVEAGIEKFVTWYQEYYQLES